MWSDQQLKEQKSDFSYKSQSIVSENLTAAHHHSKNMLKMKFIFVLIAMACLISTSHCSSSDRTLAGCITGLNRCSEAISWFSNLFMESCNDYCVRAGSIGGACVLQPTNCQLRSESATVRHCKCY